MRRHYVGGARTILRGNVARDIKSVGQGYGISAYYLDEGTRGASLKNVSVGVERPSIPYRIQQHDTITFLSPKVI